jgi:hypothetical protein
MTNLEALKGKLSYPLKSNSFILALADRGLSDSATYLKCKEFDLAYADVIMTLLTVPNVSESGYSISLSDKQTLLGLANGIYDKYGVASLILKPTAKFVQKW